MRDALNNPWVVGSLCVMAAGLMCWQWLGLEDVQPDNPVEPVPVVAMVTPQAAMPTEMRHMEQNHPVVRGEWKQWMTTFPRDPFQPVSFKDENLNVHRNTESRGEPLRGRGLQLQALSVEGKKRFVVINRSIVSEGEHVDGYMVVNIEAHGVTVAGPAGQHRLVFGRETRDEDDE